MVRDHVGTMLTGLSSICLVRSAPEAEAEALREAHIISMNLGMKNVIFESDNKEIIDAINGNSTAWYFRNYLEIFQTWKSEGDCFIYKWVRQEANEAAHCIVRLQSRGLLSKIGCLILPKF